MTTYAVVTSFSAGGWTQYGRRFVETFLNHWPADVALYIFTDGIKADDAHVDRRLHWMRLEDDPEHEAFCTANAGRDDPRDWNMMPVKFCHKVFAVTSPLIRAAADWLAWIDADSWTTVPVTEKHLAKLFPPTAILTYLGRTGMMRPGQPAYTEAGFVGYRASSVLGSDVLGRMRAIYTSGRLFDLGQYNWHDSHVFDVSRLESGLQPDRLNNLSAHLPPNVFHVWPHTVLGEFSQHAKGPRRKMAAYGRA